ncbi:hypothetical protein E2K99_02725 [Herbaspirillum huttiense]|uniref:hypothetical protein n=1 Tax=Herbaspirillum huttiense TaxID=863372 RepID=UPI001066E3CC|nr:hypothetical protein [Herbaspirillum huttiense]QBP73992.1 hypothetical protein E2K99_02725 [Herbaspirillum huttiense]
MQWKKLGKVWEPDGTLWWARKYASCPTPVFLDDGNVRVYIQCRDDQNVGRIGFVDLKRNDLTQVLNVSKEPVLDVGSAGAFDDNGVFQTTVIRQTDGRWLMYYVGFELCHHIRYRLLTGLAFSEDGTKFSKAKTTPILERSDQEMHFRCGTFVLPPENGLYKMWYVGGSEWEEIDGKLMPVYDLRYAESQDGINWPAQGQCIMKVEPNSEHGFGRPYIIFRDGLYQMFYSIRKKNPRGYRMGYAESADGIHWIRKDAELGLDTSNSGWDSESIEYGAVLDIDGKTYCFYNGNDFGGTGFGLAELNK